MKFCRRQELPVRGKVVIRTFHVDQRKPQEGNFLAALQLRLADRDEETQSLFHAVIGIMGQQIQRQILNDV